MTEKDESLLINPEEIQKRRRKPKEEMLEEEKFNVPEGKKYYNRGGTVAINYETMGRFSLPETLYFKDYTIEDINNITLTRPEEIMNNLVAVLNTKVNEDSGIKVENMLLEEFLETLVGIKMQFNTPLHTHRWICDCQIGIDPDDQQVNETEIDLRTLKYDSIEKGDEFIRGHYKKMFDKMSEESFQSYLKHRYKNYDISKITKEDELKKISIKEPILLNLDGHEYGFRFTRVGDIITSQQMANKKFFGEIKRIRNRREANVPLAELKAKKEEEIQKIQEAKARIMILYAKAMSLVSIDGEELSPEQRVEKYGKLPRQVMLELNDFLDSIKFGIQDERKLSCQLCGNTVARSLQQDLNAIELLPLESAPTRELRESTTINLYFGT